MIRLAWLHESIKAKAVQPIRFHLLYEADVLSSSGSIRSPTPHLEKVTYISATPAEQQRGGNGDLTAGHDSSDLAKAQSDGLASSQRGHPSPNQHRRKFNQMSSPLLSNPRQPPKLHRTTTSEFERDRDRILPDPPAWMKENQMYASCRSTYADPPNAPFIAQLDKIKEARLLTLDEIGVRAYATSIASISAYPHVLQSGTEVLRLPGCDHKIASLWEEWYASADDDIDRRVEAIAALEKDDDLKHLKLFFEIWGVGPETAKRFYYDRGWKDLDDVIEYGWKTLNRVQQIGVKYYDEFLERIPRAEVEEIAAVIHRHARSCRGIPESDWDTDNDIVTVIVGGYRRGKTASGDVDVVLSHRKESVTKDLVIAIVSSLEAENWITHTLTLNTTTSDRNQQTLPYRGEGDGHGFDSLDKALCVWQNPVYDTEKHDKNPNIHRRVDIIIGAWRTIGCAVLGWSGANTFQRDIRRFVKREKGWKFDSSGVRDRATGHVLDLESPRNDQEGDTWLDREKRLMNGLGIGWRPPEERCTG